MSVGLKNPANSYGSILFETFWVLDFPNGWLSHQHGLNCTPCMIYVVSIGILQLKLHHVEVGMLFNAWLSEDEQVFKGMQDRTDGYYSKGAVVIG